MYYFIVLMGQEPGIKGLDINCGYLEYMRYTDYRHPFERSFYVRSVPYSALTLQ
jgi:hypothetical protein